MPLVAGSHATPAGLIEELENERASKPGNLSPISLRESSLAGRLVERHPRDQNGWTALIRAAKRGHGMVMEMLLDNRANIEAQDRCGETALIWAAKKGHEKVKMLLDNRANIEAQEQFEEVMRR